MQNIGLNIVQSFDVERKIKQSLIPNNFFEELSLRKKSMDNNVFPGRVITSGEVVRCTDTGILKSSSTLVAEADMTSSVFTDTESNDVSSKLPAGRRAMNERLRTPFKPVALKKARNKLQNSCHGEGGMSKQCESLFKRMRSMYPPKKPLSFDPRYSVRKVVNKSGLLKALGGPELVEEEDDDDEPSECRENGGSTCSACHSQMSPGSFVSNVGQECNMKTCSPIVNTEDFIKDMVPSQSSQFLTVEDNVPSSIFNEQMRSPRSSFVEEFEKNILEDKDDSFYSANGEPFCGAFPFSPKANISIPSSSNSPSPDGFEEGTSPASAVSSISPTQASSNYQYDTVVMKRTVEMQLVQYLPTENEEWERYHSSEN